VKVHLIDGSGFVYRAYHALPKFQRSDGLEVGAVRGFAEMLWRAIRVMDGTHVAVIMDGGRSRRDEIYPRYKSNRSETDPELKMQFPLIDRACEAFGVATRRVENYEADDVIATLATHIESLGGITTIHSSDKDFCQLMSPQIRIFDPHPDRKRLLEVSDCRKRFGVPPHQVVCAQALIGDTGVMWIGKGAAAKLLEAFGDLDSVLTAVGNGDVGKLLNKRQLAAFHDRDEDDLTGFERARLSRRLAELRIDVPLGFDLDDIVRREPDDATLNAWLDSMEFAGLASKIEMQAA
jgi:DNA polymerase-1